MLHPPLLFEGQRQAEVSGLGSHVLYLPQMGAVKCALPMLELKAADLWYRFLFPHNPLSCTSVYRIWPNII